jgi:hypothetical protein
MTMRPRPIRIEGDHAYVPLTQGLEAVIDAEDVPLVEGRNWFTWKNSRGRVYAQRQSRLDGPGKQRQRVLPMHRVIVDAPDDMFVDHIDGDGLNNRRSNLRIVTNAQNMQNRGKPSNNTSGYKGVSKNRTRWEAVIRAHGRVKYLGSFGSALEAHQAYLAEAAVLHGEYMNGGDNARPE